MTFLEQFIAANDLLFNNIGGYFLCAAYLKPMTDDLSSVQETRTKNSVRMSCILARVFSHARNLFRVGHSSIPSKFLVQVSWMENLGRLSWALWD